MPGEAEGFALTDHGSALVRFPVRSVLLSRLSLPVALPWLLVATLAVLVLLVALRRLGGAIAQPASPLLLAGSGLFALLYARLTLAALPSVPRGGRTALLGALAALLVAWGWALSISGSSVWGLVLLWIFVSAAVADVALDVLRPAARSHVRSTQRARRPAISTSVHDATQIANVAAISQQTRWRAQEQGETVRGWLLADFAPGQRLAVAHVAFCPPFPTLPEVVAIAEPHDSPPARVRVTQVLHGGARLEIKRTGPLANAQGVRISYTVTIGSVPPDPPANP